MAVKALLFDFNGVIIDDEKLHMKAYQEILKHDEIDLTEADYMASLGMDDRTFVKAAFERAGRIADDERIDEIVTTKSGRWKELVSADPPLFDGVENFVEKCANEFELGIVSMARRHEIEHILNTTNLAKHFSVIVSAEDVINCKPDPQCYRLGFEKLDAARISKGHLPMIHRDCVVIEDTPPGIRGAVAADLPALGVTNTVSAEALREAGATAIAKDLSDWMPESIKRLYA